MASGGPGLPQLRSERLRARAQLQRPHLEPAAQGRARQILRGRLLGLPQGPLASGSPARRAGFPGAAGQRDRGPPLRRRADPQLAQQPRLRHQGRQHRGREAARHLPVAGAASDRQAHARAGRRDLPERRTDQRARRPLRCRRRRHPADQAARYLAFHYRGLAARALESQAQADRRRAGYRARPIHQPRRGVRAPGPRATPGQGLSTPQGPESGRR